MLRIEYAYWLLAAFFGHHHAQILREVFHRLDEAEPRILHQKTDCRAMRAATEAVIKLLGLADRKRRGFFGVKRAAGSIIRARAFQLHMAVNHIDNIDAIEQILDERLRNHGEYASIRRGAKHC